MLTLTDPASVLKSVALLPPNSAPARKNSSVGGSPHYKASGREARPYRNDSTRLSLPPDVAFVFSDAATYVSLCRPHGRFGDLARSRFSYAQCNNQETGRLQDLRDLREVAGRVEGRVGRRRAGRGG